MRSDVFVRHTCVISSIIIPLLFTQVFNVHVFLLDFLLFIVDWCGMLEPLPDVLSGFFHRRVGRTDYSWNC